jgi:hypothetical protein
MVRETRAVGTSLVRSCILTPTTASLVLLVRYNVCMSSLFPKPDEGFEPKATEGVLAKYCARCGQHLDLHGTIWKTAEGSLRTCVAPVHHQSVPSAYVEEIIEVAPSNRAVPNPPFGTDLNAATPGHVHTGRRIVNQPTTTGGTRAGVVADVARETKVHHSRRYDHGHLHGAAVHTDKAPEAERRSVPCRRSNISSAQGAALLF